MLGVRRAVDIAVGSVGLVIFGLPIAAMIGLAYLESGGVRSGLFRQTRYGLDRKPFTIFKIQNLDDNRQPLPISGLLRKTGADELPQLYNIVKGDMSIIGPRPHLRLFNLPGWSNFYAVRPGLTGLSIITEKEDGVENPPETQAAIEKLYIDQRLSAKSCLNADMDILYRTAKLVLGCKVDANKKLGMPIEL